MKKWVLLLLVPLLTSLSCTEEEESADGSPPPITEEAPGKPADPAPPKEGAKDSDFIGLSREAAEALAKERGITFRVISVDGESFPVTADYSPDRINFDIENGKVVKAKRG